MAVGNEGLALHATIGRLGITAVHDPRQFLREGRDEVELAIAAFDRLGDRLGLAKAWHLLAYLDWIRGRLTQAEAAAERARALAREAGDAGWEANAIGMHCLTLYWGPLPLETVERRSREALAEAERSGVSSLAATAYRVLARVAPTAATWRRPGGSWTPPPPSPRRRAPCSQRRWTPSRGPWWTCSPATWPPPRRSCATATGSWRRWAAPGRG
jgi:hypothetical protein